MPTKRLAIKTGIAGIGHAVDYFVLYTKATELKQRVGD